jgi:hypothetical protein
MPSFVLKRVVLCSALSHNLFHKAALLINMYNFTTFYVFQFHVLRFFYFLNKNLFTLFE